MTSVTIFNQGPGAVDVVDGSGLLHSMGEGASNVFGVPVNVQDSGSAAQTTQPADDGPRDESDAPAPAAAPADTEFEEVAA